MESLENLSDKEVVERSLHWARDLTDIASDPMARDSWAESYRDWLYRKIPEHGLFCLTMSTQLFQSDDVELRCDAVVYAEGVPENMRQEPWQRVVAALNADPHPEVQRYLEEGSLGTSPGST